MKIYIAKYNEGSYEDYREYNVFASESLIYVENWVNKYNRILGDYKDFYSKYNDEDGYWYDSEKFGYEYFDKWHKIRELNGASFEEIELIP
jgi:hypothetical protein